jgi:hypothetical protein
MGVITKQWQSLQCTPTFHESNWKEKLKLELLKMST